MSEHILVTIPFNETQQNRILAAAGDRDITFCPAHRLTDGQLSAATVIMGNVPPALLPKAPGLRWLQLNSAGANPYAADARVAPSVVLTCSVGAYNTSVSEHMLAMTLALVKRLYPYHEKQQKHEWVDLGNVPALDECTVLVLGMGDLGIAYARRMKALGSYVIGVRRRELPCPDCFDEAVTMDRLPEVLPRADITMILLPGTPYTAGLFDEKLLRTMKPGSFLLNAGRGNIIDMDSLVRVMEDGYLAGVGLDVTDPEPLPEDHPLWDTPGVWITPHIAGQFHVKVTLDNISRICADNLRAYLAGEPMKNVVDRVQQY